MNINLDYFKTFYYVAQSGSITEASHILLNNQPNVTRTIKLLEQELGCHLFERSRKGVSLTEEGHALYRRVSVMMKELTLAVQDIEHYRNLDSGKIVVATTEIALHGILLETLKSFKKLYPQIQLSVSNQTTNDALESVRKSEADFALVTGDLSENNEFQTVLLKSFREIAVCSNFYHELLHTDITLKQLSDFPIVSLNTRSVTYQFYKNVFRMQGLNFNVMVEAASIDQILPMVANDLGIGFIPEFYFDAMSNYPNLSKIDLRDSLPCRKIYLVRRKDRIGSLAANKLEQMIITNKNCYTF